MTTDNLTYGIVLTKADAMPKMREAFIAERLAAQKIDGQRCAYRDPRGNPCIVGVLISDEMAHAIDRGDYGHYYGVGELAEQGVFSIPGEDLQWFRDIQWAHDHKRFDNIRKLLELD